MPGPELELKQVLYSVRDHWTNNQFDHPISKVMCQAVRSNQRFLRPLQSIRKIQGVKLKVNHTPVFFIRSF